MALKVWLPLNGTLENKGISNLTFSIQGSSDNISVTKDGKIGSTYIKTTQIGGIVSDKPIALGNKITMCAWVKPSSFNTDSNLTGLFGQHRFNKNSGLGVNLKKGSSSSEGYLSVSTGNGTNRTYTTYYGSTILKANTWYHVCVSYDGEKIRFYVNGKLDGESTYLNQLNVEDYIHLYTWSLTGEYSNNTVYGSYNLLGCLNDVRIYDECLSDNQVKEIAKGLITHYKLEGLGANENLILRSNKVTGGGQASGITRTYLNDGTMKIVSETGNGNWCSLAFAENSNTNVGEKLTVGDIYTMSCDVLVEDGSTYPTLFINNGNGYKQLSGPTLKKGIWQRVYYTSTWNEPGTSYGNISLHLGFSGAIGTYYFKNFKLEKGNFSFWIPAPTDPEYKILNNNYEVDCSGYKYNGLKSGSLIYNENTPRYSQSTQIGSSGLISSPANLILANSKDFTINGWFYRTGSANITYYASAENYTTSIDLEGSRYFVYGSNGTAYVGYWTSTANIWQMITLVHDSKEKTLSLYVDGNYISQVTTSGDVYINNTLNIGGRQNSSSFVGSISDFRIYVTALSANEILTMYENSGIIDNKNNVYSYEFKEE